jgi:hypothetical protein
MELTQEEIVAKIQHEENIAYGINDSALSEERAEAIQYYLGEPFGNEVEGRSQVVSYDTQDTIESALPQLLKVFVSGDEVVRFEPKGPEDQEAADQETDYINHIVMEKNNGFEVFYVWFKDALLSKNGYVKVYYEEEEDYDEESYEGLTEAQLNLLVFDENVEILEHESYPDPSVQPMPMTPPMVTEGPDVQPLDGGIEIDMQTQQAFMQPMLHDVKIKVKEISGKIKVKNVAPENIMVSVDAYGTCLNSARFVQHRELMSPAEIAETFDISEDEIDSIMADTQDAFELESNARDIYSEQYDRAVDTSEILVKDTYLKINDERKRYVVIGNQIIYEEECEYVPFACITPMLMPHRHIGRSYADLTKDIQLVKSTLIRGQLDNMYLSNNGRYAISDRVNLDDMLTSRPGGIVRVQGEPGTSIMPLQHAPFPPISFQMVEYMDSMKEKRTGVTAYNQGLDSNSLNKTATGVAQIMSAAQQRLELVARTFAETGVKDLFLLVHRLVRQNLTKPDIVRIRNKWVEIDPRTWKHRKDLSISVGLGSGNKDQQLMHLNTILQMQREALQVGLTDPSKIYNALAKLTQNAGFKNPDEFWTDPSNNPMPQQQPNPQDQLIQGQLAIEQQKAQGDMAIAQAKAQANLQQEQLRSQNDVIIEREKIAAQAELERFKAQLRAETDLAIAQIKAQAGLM